MQIYKKLIKSCEKSFGHIKKPTILLIVLFVFLAFGSWLFYQSGVSFQALKLCQDDSLQERNVVLSLQNDINTKNGKIKSLTDNINELIGQRDVFVKKIDDLTSVISTVVALKTYRDENAGYEIQYPANWYTDGTNFCPKSDYNKIDGCGYYNKVMSAPISLAPITLADKNLLIL